MHNCCVPLLLLGNTRVISQTSLQTFQKEMGHVINDPYKVGNFSLKCQTSNFLECY